MDTAWLWIALAAGLLGSGVVAWRFVRPAVPAAGARQEPARGARAFRASAFPPDPGQVKAATLQKELLRQVHSLPFSDVASQAPRVVGSAHASLVSRSVALLQDVGDDVRRTPRRPGLLPQLMREVSDPQSSGASIARIVGQDPVLAASLLRIANSALYRVQTRPVESMERAVASVVTDGIRRLVAAALVQPVRGGAGEGLCGRRATLGWAPPGLAAAAAAARARRRAPGHAFVAQLGGLMLGLGSAVVVRTVREQYLRRPSLAPDSEVVAALLDGWAAPTACRIAARWELSHQLGPALDALPREGSAVPPVPSLRFGNIAGALALLWRDAGLDEAEALETLATIEPDRELNELVWRRLRRSLEEGIHG